MQSYQSNSMGVDTIRLGAGRVGGLVPPCGRNESGPGCSSPKGLVPGARVSVRIALVCQARKLLLEVWQARPTTAILVTHNAREAILLADQLVLLAPRPTHVIAVETISVSQEKRDGAAIEKIHADLLRRYPGNFSSS